MSGLTVTRGRVLEDNLVQPIEESETVSDQ